MQVTQTLQEIFEALIEELKHRKFLFNYANTFTGAFVAYNKNYESINVQIRGTINPDGVAVVISGEDGCISGRAKDEIMRHYMEYFDVNEQGAVCLLIPYELQACHDAGDIANILTRAYGLAVTTE